MPFIDLHCDTVSRLLATRRAGQPGSLRQADFHIDLEKLKGSGYLLQNFALFVNLKGGRDPLQEVLTLADLYWEELANNKDLAQPVLSFADLEAARREKKLGCLLTVEEGGVTGLGISPASGGPFSLRRVGSGRGTAASKSFV